MIFEDPTYDDEGVLIDEDADWKDLVETIDGKEASYDPYDTVNS
jgi:hypothetical protein